jgi:murein DD-endopeptidase MepM/ murein hydrolase activator NlpD
LVAFDIEMIQKRVRKIIRSLYSSWKDFYPDFAKFCKFLVFYFSQKVITVSRIFESYKNILVKLFTIKRGRYNRPFLHIAAMLVLCIGVVVSPFLAETYPIFTGDQAKAFEINTPQEQSIEVDSDVFETKISRKPRSEILNYTVAKGDTLSTIAEKFQISVETIRWENDLTGDGITVGDSLKILPVTGIAYKVSQGESVNSIAKKLDTDAQKIADFPFNDFANPETFALVEGQILIVPDGVKPSAQSTFTRQVFIASGPSVVSGSGFAWPAHGVVSQFAAWYHMAVDITGDVGTPIVAAHDGVVTSVSAGTWNYGYGTNVYVQNDDITTNYAHLSGINVVSGQQVKAGSTVVGWMGVTGRTTGSHLHFEVMKNGVLVNPMVYLP